MNEINLFLPNIVTAAPTKQYNISYLLARLISTLFQFKLNAFLAATF